MQFQLAGEIDMGVLNQGNRKLVVALDAMGGDNAPWALVDGAVQAVQEQDVEVILVGDIPAIEKEMGKHHGCSLPISISESVGVIEESDHPLQAMREKPRASILEAIKLVKSGKADAVVTMGSTGAAMACSTLLLGLMDGVERPALGGPLIRQISSTILVDLGTNIDCRPSQLLNFAAIGVAFARSIQGIENPSVALLNVGVEEGKGNRQTREAYPLFQASGLNFVGNVEGMDVCSNKADVIVCDGFVGNILMKFTEGLGVAMAQRVAGLLAGHIDSETIGRVADDIERVTNAVEFAGGAPVFGVDGVVVIGHGRSLATSVFEAINMAKRIVETGMIQTMRREIKKLH